MEAIKNLTDYRARAKNYWESHGLPARKFEAWKHTLMRVFQLPERFEKLPSSLLGGTPFFFDVPNKIGLQWGKGLDVLHSRFDSSLISYIRLPWNDQTLALQHYEVDYQQHPLASLVQAESDQIDVVDIATHHEATLHLVHLLPISAQPSSCHASRLIRIGAHAKLTLIEEVQGAGPQVLVNHLTFIELAEGAELHYVHLSKQESESPEIHGLHIWQAQTSQVKIHSLCLGQGAMRQDIEAHLQGEGAEISAYHTLVAQGGSHHDQHVTVHHNAPQTRSMVDIRAVSADQACTVSHAKVIIPPGSTDADATQNLHHLLLSPAARAAAEPQLLVNTDQVKCSHGATVGQLDQDALHYCLSRGISTTMAYQMLTQAFLADRFILIEQPIIQDQLNDFLNQALGQYFDKK